MSAYSEHSADLDSVYAELGADAPVFTWNSGTWKCLPAGAKFKRLNDVGGYTLSSDLELTATTDQFGGTLPDSEEGISYNGKAYTIVSVTPAPGGHQMRIMADLSSQGL